MLGQLKPLIAAPAAIVPCNRLLAAEQAKLGIAGNQGERATGVRVRNRIAVGVEPHKSSAIDSHGRYQVGGRKRIGQRQ